MLEAIDPTVQVAFISVFSVTITTAGVIMVAWLNNRKERGNAAEAGVEAGLDEKNVLDQVLSLMAENNRKEDTITALRKRLRDKETENRELRAKLRMERDLS